MATILIRNIPEEDRKNLRHIALDKGISLNSLLLEILHRTAANYSK